MLVLVADDMAGMRELLVASLLCVAPGCSVIEAENGHDAFLKYLLHKPDLVITDHQMGCCFSGSYLARSIRAIEESHTPIMLFTSDLDGVADRTIFTESYSKDKVLSALGHYFRRLQDVG